MTTLTGGRLRIGQPGRQDEPSNGNELLVLAERAALAGGSLVQAADLPLDVRRKDGGRGIVTSLDCAVEERIREVILAARPNDRFIGEELSPLAGNGGVEWIVDPIDGTNNFVSGLDQWSVSIAARIGPRVVAGVVYLPATGEVYTACVGAGARWEGDRVRRRDGAECLDEAVVATGFAPSQDSRLGQLDQLGRVMGVVRDVRCHGAASLELCRVALGELDGYYESGLNLWDVAAAGLIASEAGVLLSGAPWSGSGTFVAARPQIATPLRRLVDSGSDD